MGFLGRVFDGLFGNGFDEFLENATDQELDDAYEERRLEWMKNGQDGTGVKTYEMRAIDREMSRRSAEKWKNDPRRNTDPNYRWTDANRWED
jgi:hypothetical protein